MLINSTLTKYLELHDVEWIPSMPEGVPPKEICIPDNHTFFRLTKDENITPADLKTYQELKPECDWGDKTDLSYGISLFNDIDKVNKLRKIPSLKNAKGVSKLILNAPDGVVKQTTPKIYHYTWWRTSSFDIKTVKKEMVL